MTILFLFRNGPRLALTPDDTGSVLPDPAQWARRLVLPIRKIGADALRVFDAIERDGYILIDR